MQVLETHPFTLLGCLFDSLNRNFILTTTHSELMVTSPTDDLLRKLLKFGARIRARRNDEHNRVITSSLLLVEIFQNE
jgi:hypothetical protein